MYDIELQGTQNKENVNVRSTAFNFPKWLDIKLQTWNVMIRSANDH